MYAKIRENSTTNRGITVGDSSILPAEPTKAQPGTEEKILVLCERAEAGVALHHPDDRKCLGMSEDWDHIVDQLGALADGDCSVAGDEDPDPAELE